MPVRFAKSSSAVEAHELVKRLQIRLVKELEALDGGEQSPWPLHERFAAVDWVRGEGEFGGGTRFVAQNPRLFNRASVNISQVQYEGDPSKKLASATALSSIVHPACPSAPSIHMHISWTEMKSDGEPDGYWRIMADLNPSHPNDDDTREFEAAFAQAVPDESLRQVGTEQGDRYFHIPALGRHRGVAHFYLEDHRGPDVVRDRQFAEIFGETVIQTYGRIMRRALARGVTTGEVERSTQLAYHSLYFLQVLTLDRGTTSGLLVHNENDVGILGSLPSHVNRDLLESWLPRLPALQAELLRGILAELSGKVAEVTDTVKVRIAQVAREFYKRNPAAIDLLARGHIIPPTQDNHR